MSLKFYESPAAVEPDNLKGFLPDSDSPSTVRVSSSATSFCVNPKDAFAGNKLPLHLWPEVASALGSVALLDGALKYGMSNWRAAGICLSVYVATLRRHINAFYEGETIDPESGLPHVAHMLATCAIIADAMAAGTYTDDRMVVGGYFEAAKEMTGETVRIRDKHEHREKGFEPRHYTIQDNQEVLELLEGQEGRG